MAKKKTIKYLENGEYHDATVKDVGVIEELKTESKDNLVEAINEIFLGGGKGFSDLQQKVDESTQAAQNAQQATDNLQQAANNLQQRLEEVANSGLSDEEAQKIINQAVEDAKRAQAEALQAYKEAQKELDDSMAQLKEEQKELDNSIAQFKEEQKAINKELEQAKTDIQGDIDRKNAEIEQINAVIESTKSDLTATSARLASVRNDLTNAQMDWGKVRTEITNINGKLASKMSNTDFDKYKERIERNETEITQTKNELQSKATKQDLDVLTGTVTTQGSSITQLAGKIEQKVSKDTLANDIDDFQVKKANIFTGTREFMGWEFSDKALGRVNDDIYNHAKVAELHNGSNLSITVDGLEVGKTYSVSIFAKASANSNTSGVKVTVDNGKSYSGLMRTVYTPHDTKVTTNWQRYYATIVASATTMKFVFDRSGMTSNITMYLNRPKLEVGATVYAWEDNAQDIYKRVEHTEAQFDVYNDQISGIVKRQTETDKKIENVSSTFTQHANGIEANVKKYTNDKVTGLTEEFSGKLRATSEQLSTEYEKQTNAKIGALSDGGSNLILNSSFLVTDNNGNATLENWRDTSSKISLTKPNGLDGTWIRVNRATTGTTLGARSNYFPVKQGKLVVGVDVALDGTGNISPYVLRIEYYDVSNNRVNYEDITLQKLGLSASQITKSGSNFRYARGVYKTSNDRSDVAKACIVVPETITGYNMYLTNFFAKFSDVNDGTYEVNPLDQQASLIKQRTKIEQDSEKINLLNTQTEKLGNDIKATNTSVNVLKGEVDLKASQSTVNNLTNRVSKNEADIKVFPDKIKSEVREVSKKIDGVNDKVDGIQVGGTNLIPHSEVDTIRGNTDYWVFSTGNINNYGGRYNPTDKSLELEAHIKDTNYQFLQWQQQNNVLMNTELAHLQVGDVLTVSAEVYIQNPNMSGNITLGFRVNPRTNYNSYFSTERGIDLRNLKTGWQRVSATGTITQKYLDCIKDVQLIRILLAANGLKENNKIAFRKIKVEKGNIATDWSPAPEDTDESIELVKTVATQTKDGFERLTQKTGYNASTGEFSKITTQINEGIKGVSSEVKSVSNRLDNLSVGGTNLLKGTSRGLQQKSTTNDWVRLPYNTDFFRSIYPLDNFTARVWIEKPNKDSWLQAYVGGNGLFKGNVIKAGQSGYSEVHGTLNKDITGANLVIGAGDGLSVSLSWKELKLEKGTIVTDWSPAPEDTNSSIESAKSIATQTKDGFDRLTQKTGYNASTGEFSKITTQINEGIKGVSSEVKSVSNRLDNLSVGGTNLLKGTSRGLQQKSTTNDWVRLPYNTDFFRSIYPLDNFTARVWIEKPNKDSWLQAYVGGNGLFKGNVIKAGQSGYSEVHGTLNKDITGANLVIGAGDGLSVSLSWKELKLEKGTIVTDWSPAPEDLQEGINTATTKATQTDTKFERMISQIQYNDSTGEIGKYEHKITELANGTQEKISALTKRGNNMVIKSSFDEGTDLGGWYNASGAGFSNEFYRTTTIPKPDEMSSNYCVALGGRDALEANNIFPVVSGTKYYISAWVYTSRKYSGKVGLYVKNSNNNNVTHLGVAVPKDNQNRWIKIKGTITIPNGYNTAQPWLQVEKTTNDNEKIYFADISITRADDNAIELSETMTTRIGDLEKTVRTNTTNLGQYRQEMTNSAQELSLKLTSYQNLVLNDISGVKNGIGGTNLVRNGACNSNDTSHWSTNGRGKLYVLKHALFKNSSVNHFGLENNTNNEMIIYSDWIDVQPNTDYTLSYYRYGYSSVQSGDTYIQFKHGDGATRWQGVETRYKFSPSYAEYKKFTFRTDGSDKQLQVRFDNNGGGTAMFAAIKLEQGVIATDWSPSPEDTDNKIEILQGQITANANKFNTVYTKTDVDNKISPLNSRTEFLQDNSKFLLRVTQAGGATKADVNSANSKIGDLTTRVKNTEVAITSGGVTINGNTTINGELEAKEIVMKATNGAKLKLNAQGLNMETYNGAQLNLGTDKMELISPYYSNYNPLSWRTVIDDKGLGITEAQFGYDNTLKYYNEIQGYVGPGYANRVDGDLPERINSGIEIGLMPFKAYGGDKQDKTKEIYGGDYIAIGEYHKDDKLMKKRKMNAGYVFLTYDDDVYDMKIFSDNDKPNPRQGNNLIGNTTFIPSGIEGGIAVTWTNWSDWTGKIPAVMRYDGPGKWLGCIAFGGDGNVILSGGGKRWNLLGH